MNELYCQYCGCKEVADNIVNIKYKKNDFILICNKHLIQLEKKRDKKGTLSGNFKPKKIKISPTMRRTLRTIKNIKNFKFVMNIEGQGGNKDDKI